MEIKNKSIIITGASSGIFKNIKGLGREVQKWIGELINLKVI